jgi:hypothetical protein
MARLVGVSLGYQASPSVVWLSPTRLTNLGFLLRENLAAIFITTSSWGSQLAGHLLGISKHDKKDVKTRIQKSQKKKESLTAHVLQLPSQPLVLLFQCKIVLAYFC